MQEKYGPKLLLSKETYKTKYCMDGESFFESKVRFARALADSNEHYQKLLDILLDQRFMGAGRTQSAIGAPRQVTAFNCYVSGTIQDSMEDIMAKASEAAETMRRAGGIGYDFSTIRPKGDLIVSLDSRSSGPVSFMGIYNAVCKTISSAGHRRGAQMAVLRIDHPDIEEFVRAKNNKTELTGFNTSIGVTDEFLRAVENEEMFDLVFNGVVHKRVYAPALWEEIMDSTWDWAEPGVLFIDRINQMNNLYYCETIAATNPCGEQPLPPYGACLLGSFNLTKYLTKTPEGRSFNFEQFAADIPPVVRAMDNIHDVSIFPLEEQAKESAAKRRMGLGITGLANAGEILGYPYGSPEFLDFQQTVLELLRDMAYASSVDLAKEKGAFPLFDAEKYSKAKFIKLLPMDIQRSIKKHGIRNSHLLSIAPTGTMSLCADNVSSGIEPVFSHSYDRTIQTFDGPVVTKVTDYAFREEGVLGKTADKCNVAEHLSVLALAQEYVDSAVSKTINVSKDMPRDEFKDIYMNAWKLGCKGVTTFNKDGKRFGILTDTVEEEEKPQACYIDPITGDKECS